VPEVLVARHGTRGGDVIEMVGGVPGVLHDEVRFSMLEQEPSAPPFVLGIAEPVRLEDRPGLAPIRKWVCTAQVRRNTGFRMEHIGIDHGRVSSVPYIAFSGSPEVVAGSSRLIPPSTHRQRLRPSL
jgi:hypothetical protein